MDPAKRTCPIYCQGSSSKRGKKNSESSIVSTFSKIMCGESYDAVMVVPPTIAEKLKSLHVKKVTLEDPDKVKWDVHLTNIEGSSVFYNGWDNFVRYNGIELGDSLAFYYFGDSHFSVKIYGGNGCPKFFPSARRMRYNNTRIADTATSSIPKKHPSDSLYEPSARKSRFNSFARNIVIVTRSQSNIHKTPKVVPVSKTLEDPYFMTRRLTNVAVEDGSIENSESSIVPSFSKIMCGESYDAVMVVPPTIAEKLKSLRVKKVTLGDHDNRKWDVHLTNLEGSTAFYKGWHNFVLYNGIELGDFLVFYYFGDSHFFVNIYGSDGCPEFLPSVRSIKNNKKRTAETATSSIPKKRPSDSLYEPSARKNRFNSSARNIVVTRSQSDIHKTPKAVPELKTFGDPCFMTSRVTNVDVEDGRELLLDLSAFEMRGKKPTNDRENDLPEKQTDVKATVGDYQHKKRSSPVPDKFPAFEKGAASTSTRYYPTSERNTEILSEADFLGRERSPLSSKSLNADSPLDSVIPPKIIPAPKSSKFSGQPDDNQPSQVVKKEFADAAVDVSVGATSISTGRSTRPIKQEAMADRCLGDEQYVKIYCIEGCCKNLSPTLNDEAVVKKFPKSEPVDCDAPSQPF